MPHRSLPHSLRDQRGTSIVELALFMPFMIMLIVGIIDLSNGIAMQFGLNKAVNRTLELATANSVVTNKNASEVRSEEHTSELQSLMRISYAVFCLKKKQQIPTMKTYTSSKSTNKSKNIYD